MKVIDGWVKIKKYADDDGKPVCGECHWNKWRPCCDYQQNTATYGFFVTRLHDRIPGPSCPIWHGESKRKSNVTKCGHGTRSDMACEACQDEVSALDLAAYLESQEK